MAGTALTAVMAHTPNALAQAFDVDSVFEKPSQKGVILASAEIGVGSPTKYLPRAAMLEQALKNATNGSSYGVRMWAKMLNDLRSADPMTQIRMVNAFFNQVRYVGEASGENSWKLPAQFLAEGGDCEDYAIAKFVSLRLLGFHPDRVRLLFVENTMSGAQHAIAAVYYNGKILALDNRMQDVVLCNNMTQYNPICSFDEKRLWLHWTPGHSAKTVASLQHQLDKQG